MHRLRGNGQREQNIAHILLHYNGQCSSWKDVLSGVPQGSVLGPVLFLIFINDIDVSVACKVLKLVDDTKIYRIVNSQEHIESLRNDFKNLVKWSVDWEMLFNADKCKIIHIRHSNCHADYYMCCLLYTSPSPRD